MVNNCTPVPCYNNTGGIVMEEQHPANVRYPTQVSPFARLCLEALANHDLGDKISLGGAFGLLHYLDYRPTNDVDAWWMESTTDKDRQQVIKTIESSLSQHGEVRTRKWGEVVSIELVQDEQIRFTFQIAQRSAQLQPAVLAPETHIFLDSFPDLVSSKMVALVERGAPRDFRDIFALCQAGLTTPVQCWQWWRKRQQLANSDIDLERARLAIETHLTRISNHRPLEIISDPVQRKAAEEVRTWFTEVFTSVLVD